MKGITVSTKERREAKVTARRMKGSLYTYNTDFLATSRNIGYCTDNVLASELRDIMYLIRKAQEKLDDIIGIDDEV